jgi:5-methylcytosine-specific restriction endonuclease McrA
MHTAEEWTSLLDACGRRCVRCGVPEIQARGGLCRDHIIPLVAGGSDAITNIQPLCCRCNSSKTLDSTDYRPAALVAALQGSTHGP